MPNSDSRPPIVALVGPTAVGKTAFSLELAEQLGAEIVSADSRLFYRGMDIGTAKPSLVERQRVPHHLIDVSDPDDGWSLSRFQAAATAVIDEIHARGKCPLLVGGTGQFVRAITQGWSPPQIAERPELRQVLTRLGELDGWEVLHTWLARLDPLAAEAIDGRNLRRTVRALEVIYLTGKLFSEQRVRSNSRYRVLQLGLTRPRIELYQRIDERIDRMFADGLVAEVSGLLARYPSDLRSFSAIGYRQVIEHLQGRLSLTETRDEIRKATRIFVRRQANWFKENDRSIHWYGPEEAPLEIVLGQCRQHLVGSVAGTRSGG